MKLLFTYLFIFIHVGVVWSQGNEIVTLKKRLQTPDIEYDEQCDVFNNLAFEYQFSSLDSMQHYIFLAEKVALINDYRKGKANNNYNKGILSSKQFKHQEAIDFFLQSLNGFNALKDLKGASKVYTALGIIYAKKRDFERALNYFDQALDVKEKLGDQIGLANIYGSMALLFSQSGNPQKALSYFNKSLEIYQKEGVEKKMAYTFLNIGGLYYGLGNFPLSLENFHKAKYIFEASHQQSGYIKCINNIGSIYRVQEKFDKAIDHYKIVETYYKKEKSIHQLANTYINIANVFRMKQSLDSALHYYDLSLQYSKQIDYIMGVSTALYGKSNVFIDEDLFDKALITLTTAVKIKKEVNDKEGLSHCYLNISEIYIETKIADKAIEMGRRGLVLAEEGEFVELIQRGHQLLSKAFYLKEEYKFALEHHKHYSALKDSLLNEESVQKLTALEYEYKYKKQIDEANISLKASEEKRMYWLFVFITSLLATGFIIFLLIIRNIKKKNQQLLLEQRLLRSQMNPHFVFNALGVLQGIILQKEIKKSIEYLGKFSKLLRFILENSREKMVTLEKELTIVNTFIDLQNLGVQEPFQFTIEIDDDIEQNQVVIPAMIIQPFIENAIEHGFKKADSNKCIYLNVSKEKGVLIIIIEDNGLGIDQTQRSNLNKVSLSTKISRERVQLISEEFNTKAKISIEDLKSMHKNGTSVRIELPYQKRTL
ncbi:MAG: tetratricopeptide repeat protein [Flavobacteriales bacterium]